MRFQVAKRDLEDALGVVTPSLESTSGTALTTHYVFRRSGTNDDDYGVDAITLSGNIFSSCPVKAKVLDPGKKGVFTIEGKRLKQWLQHVDDAALTFELNDAVVCATAPKGSQTFQSLSPDSRYDWRETLKEAKVIATLPANRLATALGYSARFASTKEQAKPELCICEIKEGVLYSTDKKAVTLIRVAGMEESNLRIHASDVKGFTAFLGECGTGDVEILEHDRMLVLRRGDGAVFGESRFVGKFPGVTLSMDDVDQHVLTMSKPELLAAIGFLKSGAANEDNRLRMVPSKDGGVVLSMMSQTGTRTELSVLSGEMVSAKDAPKVPGAGFNMDHLGLSKVLGAWKEDDVAFGINVKGDRGYVRFVTELSGDKYLTIMAWLQ